MEATPAVSVWAEVMNCSTAGAAGLTVSVCEIAARPAGETVSVGAPNLVSSYVKLALLPPAEMVTLVIWVAPLKNSPLAEVVVRAIVCVAAAVAVLP